MNFLSQLNYENQEIRVVGTVENPWWVAQDVCKVLDIKNVGDVLSRLDDDEKRDDIDITDSIGRQQKMICINESGLYNLIFVSRKDRAKKFKKWITSEVIPSIRKTGSYSTLTAKPNSTAEQVLLMFESLQNQLKSLTARTEQLDKYEKGGIESPGCAEILLDDDDSEMTAYEFVLSRGISVQQTNTISKRASQIQRGARQNEEINKVGNRNILKLKYLKQAAITSLKLK